MIVEFDPEGNALNAWGGPDHHPGWPGRLQTMGVDRDKNVYVSGTMPGDSIIKFSSDGKFLWDFGHRGPKVPGNQVKMNNQQTDIFPPGIGAFDFDEDAREIYITDGFLNKRVLVYDMDTGAFKRGWGGHGMPLSEITNEPTAPYKWTGGPPPDQADFAPALHCVHVSTDKHVYVCERGMNRIQVFTTDGKWVKDFQVRLKRRPAATGAAASGTRPRRPAALSTTWRSRATRSRNTCSPPTARTTASGSSIGRAARPGVVRWQRPVRGQLHWIDAIKVDSKGNIYTGEVEDGKRVQKFVPVMAACEVRNEHVVHASGFSASRFVFRFGSNF